MSNRKEDDVAVEVEKKASDPSPPCPSVLERLGKTPDCHEEDKISEYLYEIYQAMTLQEALEILTEAIKYHTDDVNFPLKTMDRIKDLVEGPLQANMDQAAYEEEVKIEAVLIGHHSPYPEIRAVTDPFDDPEELCETFRAYFLGLFWTVIGTGVNQFFSPRQPTITVSSGILQIFMFPCGRAMQYLPDWGFNFRGTRYSLNPGPWTFKEQMLATIIFNVSIGGTYVAAYNLITQKLPLFYDNTWATFGYQTLLALSTQFVGFGFAGIIRRLTVYPVRSVWPTILPTIALNRALVSPEPRKTVNGWSVSRYRFFSYVFSGAFLYFWIPNYLFQALSFFNWMTWISPQNFNLAAITGSITGLGINPITTFDWTIINYNSCLQVPFYSQANQYIGTFIAGVALIPALYYTNYKWTAYLPINSNKLFTNTGAPYEVSKILTDGLLDEKKYNDYSPPFYTASNLIIYGAFFTLYPFAVIYTFVTEWRTIYFSFRDIWKSIRHPRRSNFEEHSDNHSKMMRSYPECPDWWFFAVMIIALVLGIVCVEHYPTNTPVWGIFFALGINFVFLIPITIIYSATGFSFGLNVLVELIVGYALPGNGIALMILKAYGYNIDGQAQNYISDQKIGHYCKVPPRAMFKGQMISTLVQVFVSLGIMNWQLTNIDDLCTKNQPDKFTCPSSHTMFSASIIWGVIGPKRVFKGLYPVLQWCFLIGALLPIPCLLARRFFPRATYYFQPTLIIGGMLQYAPYNMSYLTPGIYVSYVFMSYIRGKYYHWWERYNYVLASSIQAGVAFSAIIIFFAVQYHPKDIVWWGNTVSFAGKDAMGGALKEVPADPGYFGPAPGSYP